MFLRKSGFWIVSGLFRPARRTGERGSNRLVCWAHDCHSNSVVIGFLDFWGSWGARGARNRHPGALPGPPDRLATSIFNVAGWGTTRGSFECS
jgi:hypothetical protein